MKKLNIIIIVDDDPINNMICKAVIKNDYKALDVVSFEHPEKALDYIKNEYSSEKTKESTILLLDINMPIISGWQFLDHFGEFSFATKDAIIVYILSSSISEIDKATAAKNNYIKGYLEKPFNNQTLSGIMRDLKLEAV